MRQPARDHRSVAGKKLAATPTALKSTLAGTPYLKLDSLDLSGVWRFRELLPAAASRRSTSSPCAKATRHSTNFRNAPASRRAAPLCQASGNESHRLVQGRWHDRRRNLRPPGWIPLGGLRFHRQHFGVHGRLCRARRHAQPGARARRKNFLEQTFSGPRLRRAHLPAPHRFRWLPPPAAGIGAARPGLPVEFDQSRFASKGRKLSRSNCWSNSTGSRPTTSLCPAETSATVPPSARRCWKCSISA